MNMKQWVSEQYTEKQMIEIINDVGVCKKAETVELYEKFHEEIWNILYEKSNKRNCTILELIEREIKFYDYENITNDSQFKTILVWFAIKELCEDILDEKMMKEIKELGLDEFRNEEGEESIDYYDYYIDDVQKKIKRKFEWMNFNELEKATQYILNHHKNTPVVNGFITGTDTFIEKLECVRTSDEKIIFKLF